MKRLASAGGKKMFCMVYRPERFLPFGEDIFSGFLISAIRGALLLCATDGSDGWHCGCEYMISLPERPCKIRIFPVY